MSDLDRLWRGSIRPLDLERDAESVLDLVDADALPGQPRCSREALGDALQGKSSVDGKFWEDLRAREEIVFESGGRVRGAAALGADVQGTGYLLWLYCLEDREVARALTGAALTRLRGCTRIRAFWFATALGLGLEGLPVRKRAVTHREVLEHGLHGSDLWSYMVCQDLPRSNESIARVRRVGGGGAWVLEVRSRMRTIATCQIGLATEGCGVLWWISVDESKRGSGIGRRLLRQALEVLASHGARTAILYVDDDDPSERDRRPAMSLYRSVGFEEVDRLWSYETDREGIGFRP